MCPQLRTRRYVVRHLWRTRVWEEGGAQLVEAALVISLLLMLLIGMVWMGRAYNVHETITRAAREGARFAVAPSCATCGNAYPTDAEVQNVVNAALAASSLDPAVVSGFSISRGVILNPASTLTETGVVVRLNYPFQFVVPFTSIHFTTASLSAHVQMREE